MLFLLFVYFQIKNSPLWHIITKYEKNSDSWGLCNESCMLESEGFLFVCVCGGGCVCVWGGLNPVKQRTHLLMLSWGLESAIKRQGYERPCSTVKSGPGILKCLQPPIPMCTCKWSYFKALYHGIHDILLSIWVRIVNRTPEKTLPESLLKKRLHWVIFIRLSAIISKSV